MRRLLKIVPLCLILLLSLSTPLVSASPFERQVARIASLLAEEIPSPGSKDSIDLFDFSRYLVRVSRAYQLDPLLVLAIIKVESQFKTTARSYAGAIGLMQLMPIVIREVGQEVSVVTKEDLYDPYKNLLLGIHYFTYLLDKYENDLHAALAAYNIGPTALDHRLSRRDFLPESYYRKVMAHYELFWKKSLHPIELT